MKLITTIKNAYGITIIIPDEIIISATNNNPEAPAKIIDLDAFKRHLMAELQCEDSEDGLTAIQQVLDRCIEKVVITTGNDVCILNEEID